MGAVRACDACEHRSGRRQWRGDVRRPCELHRSCSGMRARRGGKGARRAAGMGQASRALGRRGRHHALLGVVPRVRVKERRKKENGGKKKKKRGKGEQKEERRKRERDVAATVGSVEHARRTVGTQRDTRNEERGRRLISVSNGENAGKDFEELGSRTEEEFEMIRAQRQKKIEKIFLASNLFGRIFRMLQLSLH